MIAGISAGKLNTRWITKQSPTRNENNIDYLKNLRSSSFYGKTESYQVNQVRDVTKLSENNMSVVNDNLLQRPSHVNGYISSYKPQTRTNGSLKPEGSYRTPVKGGSLSYFSGGYTFNDYNERNSRSPYVSTSIARSKVENHKIKTDASILNSNSSKQRVTNIVQGLISGSNLTDSDNSNMHTTPLESSGNSYNMNSRSKRLSTSYMTISPNRQRGLSRNNNQPIFRAPSLKSIVERKNQQTFSRPIHESRPIDVNENHNIPHKILETHNINHCLSTVTSTKSDVRRIINNNSNQQGVTHSDRIPVSYIPAEGSYRSTSLTTSTSENKDKVQNLNLIRSNDQYYSNNLSQKKSSSNQNVYNHGNTISTISIKPNMDNQLNNSRVERIYTSSIHQNRNKGLAVRSESTSTNDLNHTRYSTHTNSPNKAGYPQKSNNNFNIFITQEQTSSNDRKKDYSNINTTSNYITKSGTFTQNQLAPNRIHIEQPIKTEEGKGQIQHHVSKKNDSASIVLRSKSSEIIKGAEQKYHEITHQLLKDLEVDKSIFINKLNVKNEFMMDESLKQGSYIPNKLQSTERLVANSSENKINLIGNNYKRSGSIGSSISKSRIKNISSFSTKREVNSDISSIRSNTVPPNKIKRSINPDIPIIQPYFHDSDIVKNLVPSSPIFPTAPLPHGVLVDILNAMRLPVIAETLSSIPDQINSRAGWTGKITLIWHVHVDRIDIGHPQELVIKICSCNPGRPRSLFAKNELSNLTSALMNHPMIRFDEFLAFPLGIFNVLSGPNGVPVALLTVSKKANGRPLHMVFQDHLRGPCSCDPNSRSRITNILRRCTKLFHRKYGMQHGDFQTSNIFYNDATCKFTLIDLGGIGCTQVTDNDVTHFHATLMQHLARCYGHANMWPLWLAFEAGYHSV